MARKAVKQAARAYSDFTGHKPDAAYVVPIDSRAVTGYRLGSLVGVAYEATRDGETAKYYHEFKTKARPDLVSRGDGKQLFITRGKYKVTERGIEDMAAPLFVVNPSRRKKSRKSSKSFRRNPVARTRRRRKSVSTYRRNPAVRRRRSRSLSTYRRNPTRRRRVTRYRRNPSLRGALSKFRSRRRSTGGGKGFPSFTKLIVPSLGVAGGAVITELAMGYLPIPEGLKTGMARHATKAALGLGLGMLVGKFFNRRAGEALVMGAFTISAHDAMKDGIIGFMPGAKFGMGEYVDGIDYYSPGSVTGIGAYDADDFDGDTVDMGEYVPDYA